MYKNFSRNFSRVTGWESKMFKLINTMCNHISEQFEMTVFEFIVRWAIKQKENPEIARSLDRI